MEIGDAFLLADPRIDEHLWIVISDPAQDAERIVIVSLTSHRADKDQSCILDVGHHPWIKHRTCVSYADARVASETSLDALVQSGHLRPMAAVSDEMLGLLLEGAQRTDRMPVRQRRILEDQGYIDR